ncbi:MAG: formylglycine-generating enzyme family protein [Desulfobacteraceae bacterium]|nr:formylglycine-generating enzyme family protein [Desulfobacteraceae bacterium]
MKGDAGTAHETKILTETSPDITIPAGVTTTVYGTFDANNVTIESGANANLLNLPGNNTITVESYSNLFTVFRSGSKVIFLGSDKTVLEMPVTASIQSICFNDIRMELVINNSKVMLGAQEVMSDAAAIRPVVVPPAGDFTNSLNMVFVKIPAGIFTMGSPEDELGREDDYDGVDEPRYQVTLTSSYYLQATEVTQGQWKAVMGSNPSTYSSSGDDYPVENVTWYEIQDFISKLNQRGEGTYSLPTEAQWEYAARAGTTTPFNTGGCLLRDQANIAGWLPYGECPISEGIYDLMPVASFPPNSWGLYDMHGNVSEWCQDVYGKYPSDAVSDPVGSGTGPYRVVRGGSWVDSPDLCRSAYRNYCYPCATCYVFGFRLTCFVDSQ